MRHLPRTLVTAVPATRFGARRAPPRSRPAVRDRRRRRRSRQGLIFRQPRPLIRSGPMKKRTRPPPPTAALTLAPALVAAPAHAATTLVVNAGSNLRAVTHVATGSLYGLANASTPADSLSSRSTRTPSCRWPRAATSRAPATSSWWRRRRPAGARRSSTGCPTTTPAGHTSTTGATGRPSSTSRSPRSRRPALRNITNFELWNEPDSTWLTANGSFNSFWTTTYRQIRSLRHEREDPGPELLRQHQRHAELPAKRGGHEHGPRHDLLARTGERGQDRR